MQRRDFFQVVAAGSSLPLSSNIATAADGTLPALPRIEDGAEVVRGDMRFRKLGKTGELISAIGLGGHHIGRQPDEADSIKIIRSAIDAGINFLDNSWDYHDGLSEMRMGKALQDGYRKKVFLMTKFDGRTKLSADAQIEQSLIRLKTDVIDLIQVHETIRLEDPDRVFEAGGAMEAVMALKKAGKVRYIGFTGHKDPLVHLRMLEVARANGFRFDAAQMPLNVMDAHFRSFARTLVPALVKEQMGILGMKPMADGMILKSKIVTAIECLQYALTLPTSVVITGIDSMEILKQDLDVIKNFKPLSLEQIAAMLAKTEKAAAKGEFEKFKTGTKFDSTAKNPAWLG